MNLDATKQIQRIQNNCPVAGPGQVKEGLLAVNLWVEVLPGFRSISRHIISVKTLKIKNVYSKMLDRYRFYYLRLYLNTRNKHRKAFAHTSTAHWPLVLVHESRPLEKDWGFGEQPTCQIKKKIANIR